MSYLLGRYSQGRLGAVPLALWLAGLMAFWVNVHGTFVLAFALGGATLAAMLLDYWRPASATPRAEPGLQAGYESGIVRTSARLWGLSGALGAMALASLANPLGPGIYRHVETALHAPGQQLVSEWQPPTPSGLAFGAFFLSILALLLVWAHQRQPPATRDLLLVCGMVWLGWSAARHVVWYGVVAIPILAEGLARMGSLPEGWLGNGRPRRAASVLALLLLIPVVLVQPWFVRRLGLGDAYTQRMLPSPAAPLLSRGTPFFAAEYLRQHPGGRLFNEMGFGSYLIWALPEPQVFVDPRVADLFPLALWEDYRAIGAGRDALELLDRYGVDRVLLRRDTQARLASALADAANWQREYMDPDAEVWRRTPAPALPNGAGTPTRVPGFT
jgi:hypothetical protein